MSGRLPARTAGRPVLYPFAELEVGDRLIVPLPKADEVGRLVNSVMAAAQRYARTHNPAFRGWCRAAATSVIFARLPDHAGAAERKRARAAARLKLLSAQTGPLAECEYREVKRLARIAA